MNRKPTRRAPRPGQAPTKRPADSSPYGGRPAGGRSDQYAQARPKAARASGKPASRHANRLPKPKPSAARDAALTGRIHKVLSNAGYGSRREIEQKITEGKVRVNGEPARLGHQIGPSDVVKIDGQTIELAFLDAPRRRILMYNKPEGEITARFDEEGRATVFDHLPRIHNARWVNIGRLDINTQGLLLFTTDGALAAHFMHPGNEIEREYAVRVFGELSLAEKRSLNTGIELEDGMAKFASIRDGGGEANNRWYHVVLKEGRNREVRRMFSAVDKQVSRLIRVRFGSLSLPADLPRGTWLELSEDQVKAVAEEIGLPTAISGAPEGSPKRGSREQARNKERRGGRHRVVDQRRQDESPRAERSAAPRNKPRNQSGRPERDQRRGENRPPSGGAVRDGGSSRSSGAWSESRSPRTSGRSDTSRATPGSGYGGPRRNDPDRSQRNSVAEAPSTGESKSWPRRDQSKPATARTGYGRGGDSRGRDFRDANGREAARDGHARRGSAGAPGSRSADPRGASRGSAKDADRRTTPKPSSGHRTSGHPTSGRPASSSGSPWKARAKKPD